MNIADVVAPTRSTTVLRARPAGFARDVSSIAGRALRAVPRDLEGVFPPVFIALFFFIVNIATLSKLTQSAGAGFDYKAFQMPTAILLGVTGISRAPALVLDVQDGYLDRLLMTPIRRLAILLGHMVADVAVAMALTVPILVLGFAIGVRFETGVLGLVAFIVLAALWSLAFSGFGYAIALKTGNPAAVNSTFLLFFPFLFLTSSYVPRSQLSGWLDHVAAVNPVTYLLEGLRSLVSQGWEWGDLAKSLLAIGVLGGISMSLCFGALRGRTRRG
ncbi:MAG TPA: ABC transporter permease [Acidimicrobiales bacterium]|jgi:ABC-2 type transport system permease protein|nr:ABC transporter permease [Acidimicrobiales bacterium]